MSCRAFFQIDSDSTCEFGLESDSFRAAPLFVEQEDADKGRVKRGTIIYVECLSTMPAVNLTRGGDEVSF